MASGSGKHAADMLKPAGDPAAVERLTAAVGRLKDASSAGKRDVEIEILEAALAAIEAKVKEVRARAAAHAANAGADWSVAALIEVLRNDVRDVVAASEAPKAPPPKEEKKNRYGDTKEVAVDKGRSAFFDTASSTRSVLETVEDALTKGDWYWVCEACGNGIQKPSKEKHKTKCKHLKPHEVKDGRYVLQGAEWVLSVVGDRPEPYLYMYTMETSLCYDLTAAMRTLAFKGDRTAYEPKKDFAYALHRALMRRPKFSGTVFRAMNFRVADAQYTTGAVVTMPQPTSASVEPKVVHAFLGGGADGAAVGTILIMRVNTARDIAPYSVYPEEREVVIPANTQFRVVGRPDVGVLQLLESALQTDLRNVAVVELQEIDLFHWGCIPGALTAAEKLQNTLLVEECMKKRPISTIPVWHPVTGEQAFTETWGCIPTCDALYLVYPRDAQIGARGAGLDKRFHYMRPEEAALVTFVWLAAQVPHNGQVVSLCVANLDCSKHDHSGAQSQHWYTPIHCSLCGVNESLAVALRMNNPVTLSHADNVAVLLSKGARPEELEEGLRHTSLALMACRCDAATVQSVAATLGTVFWGVDHATGQTVAHAAAAGNRGDLLEDLILPAGRLDVNTRDKEGRAPLHHAASCGATSAVTALLKGGADVDARMTIMARRLTRAGHTPPMTGGDTPLLLAAENGHNDIVRILTAANANVDHARNEGLDGPEYTQANFIYYVNITPAAAATMKGHTDVLASLIEAGADLLKPRKDLRLPLSLAAELGHLPALQLLLKKAPDVAAMVGFGCDRGYTALHYTCINGNAMAAEALIAAGADVNRLMKHRASPAHVAGEGGHPDILLLLVEANADLRIPDVNMNLPCHIAARNGKDDYLRVLHRHGALYMDALNRDGGTVLHEAVLGSNPTTVALLLGYGADINFPAGGRPGGETPLFIAATVPNPATLRAVLDHHPDLDARCKDQGATACHVAAHGGAATQVQMLVDAGADLSIRDSGGYTPLMIAEQQAYPRDPRTGQTGVSPPHQAAFEVLRVAEGGEELEY